jgi:FtsH-binding integral membrane protein
MPVRMQAVDFHYNTSQDSKYIDPESLEETPLVPGMSKTETMLRWGFIRKVYGIISIQLLLTTLVACVILFSEPVKGFVTTNLPFQIMCFILPLVGLIPLYIYQKKHPANLLILAAWTAVLSVSVGSACTLYQPFIVLEALALTAIIVTGLTLYTFHAARKGVDFGYLEPMLFVALLSLVGWSFFQVFFPAGPIQRTIFALFGTIIFSGYIVFDTHMLIEKYDLDEYIWASVNLYLDIINLFLKILQLLNGGDRRE